MEEEIKQTYAKLMSSDEVTILEKSVTRKKEEHVKLRRATILLAMPATTQLQYEVSIAHPVHPFNYSQLPDGSQNDADAAKMDVSIDPTKRSEPGADVVDK